MIPPVVPFKTKKILKKVQKKMKPATYAGLI